MHHTEKLLDTLAESLAGLYDDDEISRLRDQWARAATSPDTDPDDVWAFKALAAAARDALRARGAA